MTITAFDYAMLADGQVAATKTALYTVPVATEVAFKSVIFCNTNAATNTVTVWLNSSGTDRQICSIALAQNEILIIDDFTLAAGGIIKAQATNAAQVDYTITGGKAT